MATLVSPHPSVDPLKALEEERKVMAAYSDTAKTYSQLSLGALVLSITFLEKVARVEVAEAVDVLLLIAWCGWLLSALSGAFYQYLAVRFVEARGEDWGLLTRSGHRQAFSYLAHHPWPAYALMLASFAVGSVAFAVVGFQYLRIA